MQLVRVRLVEVGDVCPPDEIPGHLRPVLPPPICVELDAPRLDALWHALQQGGLGRVHTRHIQSSPHRGGQSIGAYWSDGRCTVSDIRDSQVVPGDMPSFRGLVHRVSQALSAAQERAQQPLRAIALASMRTSSRPPLVRMRFDNRGADTARARVRSVSALDHEGHAGQALGVRALVVASVPYEEVYPSSETQRPALDTWIDVPSHSSRMLEIEPDDHARYSFGLRHRYRVTIEREGGAEEALELYLDDGSRRPVHR